MEYSVMNEIIDYLKKDYGVVALIICGSRAYGDSKSNSDWDMYAFTDKKITNDPKFGNENLDITFLGTKIRFDWNIFGLKLKYSKILLDNSAHTARNILNSAMKHYAKGPKKWTKQYALGRMEKAERYEKKMLDCLKDKKHGELFLRISWHYSENLINWWFGIRNEWPLRPQQAFEYIKNKDPIFYREMSKVFMDTSSDVKVTAIHKLHKILFSSKHYKLLIK